MDTNVLQFVNEVEDAPTSMSDADDLSSMFHSGAFSDATDYAVSGPYYLLTVCQTEEDTGEHALGE